MPYNFAADNFHTKKLCSRLSSSEVRLSRGKTAVLRFRPPLGDLGATYDDQPRLIGKRVGDFLLVLIELFSLGVTTEAYVRLSVQNRRFRSNGGRLTQNFRLEGSPPPTILLLRKLGQTDRRTDRQAEISS